MKFVFKTTAVSLFIVFFGLIALGAVTGMDSGINGHDDGIDCFGAGCGPIEHVVMHSFFIPGNNIGDKNIEKTDYTALRDNDAISSRGVMIEPPPPKFSIV